MKNSLISIALFLVLVGFLVYADQNFKALCTDIINLCDKLEDTIEANDKDTNFQLTMKLFEVIESRGTIAAVYINHMDYDVMLNEALKLNIYIQQDDKSEASASLHLLKYTTMHMKSLQYPTIENIF